MIPPVVDQEWLAQHPDVRVADVRWYPDGRSGRDAWHAGHLPGAVFIDMEAVLAAPASVEGGRHPLPEPEIFAEGMSAAGIGDDSVVVAYDDAGGAYASRLVWLLRISGVDAALLDGGLDAWDGPLEVGTPVPPTASYTARSWDPVTLATIDDAGTAPQVVDARAPERYRGDQELLDARPGHIPGALNIPFAGNLGPGSLFLSPDDLRDRFADAGITSADGVVVYCGSGITACHNLIALEHAGLGRARLYPGSWSQYAATDRPAATGPVPGTQPAVGPLGFTH